jgi:hypothetical protein
MGNTLTSELVSETFLSISKENECDTQIRNYQKELKILSDISERYINSCCIFKEPFLCNFSSQISCRYESCVLHFDIITNTAKIFHLPSDIGNAYNERFYFFKETEFLRYRFLRGNQFQYFNVKKKIHTDYSDYFTNLFSRSNFPIPSFEEFESELVKDFDVSRKIINVNYYNDLFYVNTQNFSFFIYNSKTFDFEREWRHCVQTDPNSINPIYFNHQLFFSLKDEIIHQIPKLEHVSIDGTRLVTFDNPTGLGNIYDMEIFKKGVVPTEKICSFMTFDDISTIRFTDDSKHIVMMSIPMKTKNMFCQWITIFSIEEKSNVFRTCIKSIEKIEKFEIFGDFILLSKDHFVTVVNVILKVDLPDKFKKYFFHTGSQDIQFKFQ